MKYTKKAIHHILHSDSPIPTQSERNWIMACFKRTIPEKRCSYRAIMHQQYREQNEHHLQLINNYANKIQKEIVDASTEMITLVDEILKMDLLVDEDRLYYCYLKGDYCKLLLDVDHLESSKWKLLYCQTFEEGRQALDNLEPLSVIRLKTSLAASVFYYEVMNDQQKAMEIAKSAFDAAIPTLEEVNEESASEILMLLQLLRDNLTMWSVTDEPDEQD